jgi:hypothetical protein
MPKRILDFLSKKASKKLDYLGRNNRDSIPEVFIKE